MSRPSVHHAGRTWDRFGGADRYTAFGAQFRDPVLDRPIGPRLVARLVPEEPGGKSLLGVATPTDTIHAFHGLKALRPWEMGQTPEPTDPNQVPQAPFRLTVRDPAGNFLPAALDVRLPWTGTGLFWSSLGNPWVTRESASPPGSAAPAFYLFPSPSYPVPPTFAAWRGQAWDRIRDRPAPFALIEVEWIEPRTRHYGLSDEQGTFLVAFPPPRPHLAVPGSPPSGWVEAEGFLRIHYRDEAGRTDAGGIPRMERILSQPRALIHGGVGPAAPELDVRMEEAARVIRTEGSAVLFIEESP